MKQLHYVPNIILDAVDDDGNYAGDAGDDNYDADDYYDGDDNHDGDANCDYDQGQECGVN